MLTSCASLGATVTSLGSGGLGPGVSAQEAGDGAPLKFIKPDTEVTAYQHDSSLGLCTRRGRWRALLRGVSGECVRTLTAAAVLNLGVEQSFHRAT